MGLISAATDRNIKHFRRVATRYEKTALSFAAMLFSVGAAI